MLYFILLTSFFFPISHVISLIPLFSNCFLCYFLDYFPFCGSFSNRKHGSFFFTPGPEHNRREGGAQSTDRASLVVMRSRRLGDNDEYCFVLFCFSFFSSLSFFFLNAACPFLEGYYRCGYILSLFCKHRSGGRICVLVFLSTLFPIFNHLSILATILPVIFGVVISF